MGVGGWGMGGGGGGTVLLCVGDPKYNPHRGVLIGRGGVGGGGGGGGVNFLYIGGAGGPQRGFCLF